MGKRSAHGQESTDRGYVLSKDRGQVHVHVRVKQPHGRNW
jgi:hypothetical protein